uniref:Arrestin C-terminal-like domain-containing protein n=1 Tax=Haplochromis burtoni TaxID=8153 RepID=A0A3Q2VAW5_HAPBU
MFEQTIRNFKINFIRHDGRNSFSSGDQIIGHISFDLTKETKITSITMRLKGNVNVHWTAGGEDRGMLLLVLFGRSDTWQTNSHRLCPFLIATRGTKLQLGTHVYPFTCQLPLGELPSSFRGSHGKIVYRLEANLSHSVRKDSKAKLMVPLQTKMNLFTSGSVAMDVSIPKTAFLQGEDIKVMASVQNKSSRDIKLKYCLYRKNSYFANKKRKLETKDILKEEGEIITIPSTETASVLNCNIIKLENRLRVHLDVKYASDPEIKFPIIILPALEGSDKQQSSDYSASGFEASPNSDFPEGTSFLQNPAAPGVDGLPPSYETYDIEFDQFPNPYMSGGMSFLQNPAAPEPSAPPPSYETYGMYPSFTGLDRKP